MSDAYIVRRGGSGSEIKNASIEEGLAFSGTIDPNYFVSYKHAKPSQKSFVNPEWSGTAATDNSAPLTIVLDETRTLFLYCNDTGVAASSLYYAVIITEDSNGTIRTSTPIQVSDIPKGYQTCMFATRVDDNKEDFILAYGGGSDGKTSMRVLRVEGSLITLGDIVNVISSGNYSIGYGNYSINKVTSDTFLTTWSEVQGFLNYLTANLIKVSDLTLTLLADSKKDIQANAYNYARHTIVQLTPTYYVVMFSVSSADTVQTAIIRVSGTTIELGSTLALNTSGNYASEYLRSLIKLSNNQVIATWSSKTDYFLYACLLTVNGLTLTKGVDVQITSNSISNLNASLYFPFVKRLPDNNFALVGYNGAYPAIAFCFTFIAPQFFDGWAEKWFVYNTTLLERPQGMQKANLNFPTGPNLPYPIMQGKLELTEDSITIPEAAMFYTGSSYSGSDSRVSYSLTTMTFSTESKSVKMSNSLLNSNIGYTDTFSTSLRISVDQSASKPIKARIVYGLKEKYGTGAAVRALTYYYSSLTKDELDTPYFELRPKTIEIDGVTKELISKDIKGSIYIGQ